MQLMSLYAQKALEQDAAQLRVLEKLDALKAALESHETRGFSRFFAKSLPLRGLYIHGEVGRGKTMLMDLFYENIAIKAKSRWHFHEFMNEVHVQINDFRGKEKRGEVKAGDPIAYVAQNMMKQLTLLCFDEFSVVDIADAMILGRLFEKFLTGGVTIIATSNVLPDNLYKNGLNRALFLPFIAVLKEKLEVVALNSRTDYRLEKLDGHPVWLADEALFSTLFTQMAGQTKPLTLTHKGRDLHVPDTGRGVAKFTFAQLCETPLAASDYLLLAHQFHTIFVANIPKISKDKPDHAKRFINLIDALYDNHVKLVALCVFDVQALYEGGKGFETFEFTRTQSRLMEMRSSDYLALPHGRFKLLSESQEGLIET